MVTPWTTAIYELRWVDRAGKARSYPLTSQDLFKLAHAAQHEGAPTRAVIWSFLQRFAWVYPQYRSLKKLVAAYSQPVNPRWLPTGNLHKREIARIRRSTQYSQTEKDSRIAAEKRRAQRRARFARETWPDISAPIRSALKKILEGRDRSPVPGAVHFRASVATRTQTPEQAWQTTVEWARRHSRRVGMPLRTSWGVKPGKNVFFYSPPPTQNASQEFGVSIGPPDPKGCRRQPCCYCCPPQQCSCSEGN